MNQTTISRQDIDTLRTIWRDYINGVIPPPSQFSRWLRLYSIDVCVEGIEAGNRWMARTGKQYLEDIVCYVSAL